MSALEKAIAALSPGWALARARARRQLSRTYDAGAIHFQHKNPSNGTFSADAVMEDGARNMRAWARYLDENYDLAIGILSVLTQNIVGEGLDFTPMVKTRRGELHEPTNRRIRKLWREWYERPEVTRELAGCDVEQLVCRQWLRDGEVFIHHLEGRVQGLQHAGAVPYSIQLVEADHADFDLFQDRATRGHRIVHAAEKDEWGRILAWHLLPEHPGNSPFEVIGAQTDARRIPTERLTHLKFSRRLGQTRGISALHGVIHRLDSLRDIDQSEAMAVRIAAAFSAVIQKHADLEDPEAIDSSIGDKSFKMQPGMVFDNLAPGETVQTIGSNRPNANLPEFRADNIRGLARGTGTNYSSISSDYEGSYSSKRQEQAESAPQYAQPRKYFLAHYGQELYRRHLRMALTARVLTVPQVVDPETLADVEITHGGGIPWIDIQKEVAADIALRDAEIVSTAFIRRKRGLDDTDMQAQIAEERTRRPAPAAASSGPADDEDDQDDDEEAAA